MNLLKKKEAVEKFSFYIACIIRIVEKNAFSFRNQISKKKKVHNHDFLIR